MILGIIITAILLITNTLAFFSIKTDTRRDINQKGRLITLSIISAIEILAIYYAFFQYPSNLETYQEKVACTDLYYEKCGKVLKKFEGFERYGKHHDEYYGEWIIIKFNNGIYERTKVNRNTYERYDAGDNICFAEETAYHKTYMMLCILTYITMLIGFFIVLLAYILRIE